MVRAALTLHPNARCWAVEGIEVGIERSGERALTLAYRLTGETGALRLPPLAASTRGDELWRHTCFEAFIQAPDAGGYWEFNLSPSTRWGAYRFSGYRSGMSQADAIAAPRIKVQVDKGQMSLAASLDLASLPDLPADQPWRLGLSAVIEEADGNVSHWALAHPPGKADFHHALGFALDIPATEGP